jgi:hypothetical protein
MREINKKESAVRFGFAKVAHTIHRLTRQLSNAALG